MPLARAGATTLTVSSNGLHASMARRITGVSGTVLTLSHPVSDALEVGDYFLVMNIMGRDVNGNAGSFNLSAVGLHEFARVAAIDGQTITVSRDLEFDYEVGNGKHLVIMQKVSEYSALTINANWQAMPFNPDHIGDPDIYDGGQTGILLIAVRNTLTINNGGDITATNAGYWGGKCNSMDNSAAAGDGGQGRGGDSRGIASSGWGVQGTCRQAGGGGVRRGEATCVQGTTAEATCVRRRACVRQRACMRRRACVRRRRAAATDGRGRRGLAGVGGRAR